jgi:crossover junction endodeoxyribonuclease RuvC
MSHEDVYCGVDPGSKGAIAFICPARGCATVVNLPTIKEVGSSRTFTYADGEGIVALLRKYAPTRTFLERVHAMPTDGPVGAFSFGDNYGTIKGAHAGCDVPITRYLPITWKRQMGLTSDKQAAKAKAKLLFPKLAHLITRPDHAEALMLCLYGMLRLGIKPARDIIPYV